MFGHDLFAVALDEPAYLGKDEELFAAWRLDNLTSTHAGIAAIIAADETDDVPVFASFNYEEIGSMTYSGAQSPFLESVLRRIIGGVDDRYERYAQVIAASAMMSSDTGNAIHPNYPEKHEPGHRPIPGKGPMIKVSANQRYASGAEEQALFRRSAEAAGIPWQTYVNRNDIPGGTTIGPISGTQLGMLHCGRRPADPLDAFRARAVRCRGPGSAGGPGSRPVHSLGAQMPTLLRLDASAAVADSTSRSLTAAFAAAFAGSPGNAVVHRDLHADPVPHLPHPQLHWAAALRSGGAPDPADEARQEALIAELLGCGRAGDRVSAVQLFAAVESEGLDRSRACAGPDRAGGGVGFAARGAAGGAGGDAGRRLRAGGAERGARLGDAGARAGLG